MAGRPLFSASGPSGGTAFAAGSLPGHSRVFCAEVRHPIRIVLSEFQGVEREVKMRFLSRAGATLMSLLAVGAVVVGCSEPASMIGEEAFDDPSISAEFSSSAPEPGVVTSRYKLNSDSDANSADNSVGGGPDAFIFYDWDAPKGGDLFGSGAEERSKVQVFTESGGVPIGFTPAEGELARRGYSVGIQQVPDSRLLAATAALVRLPAKGLTAESFQVQVNVFDRSGGLDSTVRIDAVEEAGIYGVGLFGDTVVLRYDLDEEDPTTRDDIQYLAAIDSTSMDELWTTVVGTRDGGAMAGRSDVTGSDVVGVLHSSDFDRSPDGSILFGDEDGLTAVDPVTGETKWVEPGPRSYLGSPRPGGTYPIRIVEYNGASAHDLRDGSTLALNGVTYAIDHERDLLAVSYVYLGGFSTGPTIRGEGPAFQVIDLTDQSVVYELPGEEGLKHKKLDVLAAFDGLVWIQSGGDVSVIDALTGEPVSDSSGLANPASGIQMYRGDKWMVLGDGETPMTFLWNDNGKFTREDLAGS